MSQIRSEAVVVLAIGVPEDHRDTWQDRALALLEERGFACRALTPQDIVAQGDHIKSVWARALNHEEDTNAAE